MTFWGSGRFKEPAPTRHYEEARAHSAGDHHHGVHEPHESGWLMTAPLIVLAVLSTLGGLIGVSYAVGSLVSSHPTNYLERVLEPVFENREAEHPPQPVCKTGRRGHLRNPRHHRDRVVRTLCRTIKAANARIHIDLDVTALVTKDCSCGTSGQAFRVLAVHAHLW